MSKNILSTGCKKSVILKLLPAGFMASRVGGVRGGGLEGMEGGGIKGASLGNAILISDRFLKRARAHFATFLRGSFFYSLLKLKISTFNSYISIQFKDIYFFSTHYSILYLYS